VDGVVLTPLKRIVQIKGDIYHAIKKSDKEFNGFGEAYFSIVNKNTIKGWKRHDKMILNLCVPVGEIEFVVHNQITKEYFVESLSLKNYQRLTIEAGLWVAFKGIKSFNMLLNISSIEHDPLEATSVCLNTFAYEW
jgi:dTDP-4-dehydrorhamnose 3,5-epimerase